MRKLVFFGGKGGVGKTTMSCACAVFSAQHTLRTLLITTDPAPSLADCLEQRVNKEPTQIKDVKNLYAMEIDSHCELEKFKQQYGADIFEILQTGTYAHDEEIHEALNLDVPGIDEVMGLKVIMDYFESGSYEQIIVDTAPTGHTLRLLSMPELLDGWIKYLAKIRWRYREVFQQLVKSAPHEHPDQFLLDMKLLVKKINATIRNEKMCEFVIVTAPRKMVFAETKDLIDSLKRAGIPSHTLVINGIFPKDDRSDFVRRIYEDQQLYIQEMRKTFGDFEIIEVHQLQDEPRGKDNLISIASQLSICNRKRNPNISME